MKQNTFLKIFFGLFVVMILSYSLAGYSARRAQLESPDIASKIAQHYNLQITDSENGFYVTSIEDSKDYEQSQKTWDIEGMQTDLEFLAKSADVTIEKSADSKFHIIADGLLSRETPEDELFLVTVKRNKLQIRERRAKSTKLRIQVPSQLREISLKSVSGDLAIDGLTGHELDIATVSGDVQLSGVEFEDIDAVSVSGDVKIAMGSTGNLDIGTTSGDIHLQVQNAEHANLKLKSVSGQITSGYKGDPKSERKIDVGTISGDIALQ